MTGTLVTPVIENKVFIAENSKFLNMGDNDFLTKESEEFSPESWESESNEGADYSKTMTNDQQRLHLPDDTTDYNHMTSPGTPETDYLKYDSEKLNSMVEDVQGTKLLKRERNRLAARRCRQKQRDRISILEKNVKEIESANGLVEREIQLLQTQLKKLTDVLMTHECVIKLPQLTHSKFLTMNTNNS